MFHTQSMCFGRYLLLARYSHSAENRCMLHACQARHLARELAASRLVALISYTSASALPPRSQPGPARISSFLTFMTCFILMNTPPAHAFLRKISEIRRERLPALVLKRHGTHHTQHRL